MESLPDEQPKFTLLRIEPLYAPHIGQHQLDGRVEDAPIERVEVVLLNQQSAYFLQSQELVSPLGILSLDNRRLIVLGRRAVEEVGYGNSQRRRQLLQGARAYAVDAPLIFLDLLERHI